MKVLVVSDIHGSISSAHEIENIIAKEDPTYILMLGDFLYNGPRNGVNFDYDPMGVAKILNQYKGKIIACRGNCDARIDSELLDFPVPDVNELILFNHRLILVHGDNINDDELHLQPGDVLLFGHYHVPQIRVVEGVLLINPGSITFSKTENKVPTYIIIEDGDIKLYEKGHKLIDLKNIDTLFAK